MAAGDPFGITPYGTEAMHVLRAEKGYAIIGQDTDGTVTPQDLGMSWIVSRKKDFIGGRSHRRRAHAAPPPPPAARGWRGGHAGPPPAGGGPRAQRTHRSPL